MDRFLRHPFALASSLCAALALAASAGAQDELEDVFGEMGRASVEEAAAAQAEGTGAIVGRIVDGQTGLPLSGATVIVIWPIPADGSEAPQEVRVTDFDGSYGFPAVPEGAYTLTIVKSGYRASTITGFQVAAGEQNVADFPLPPVPLPGPGGEEVMELDAFVVEASTVGELMTALELRMDSDKLLDIMSAEDLSRYAASDVADALKRVAGVNVVEGQFAIIRGLEDRYSSTLYNHAPVPSPDPDSQSVQLDLFASDIVGNLVVAKTFAPDLPSNSSGGSIDILTHEYPEELRISLSGGSGWNQNASDRFLEYESGSPVGRDVDAGDTIESEYGGTVGGRHEWRGRELRFKGVLHREIDYETKDGVQEAREPDRARTRRGRVLEAGDLSLGELSLSRGRFDLTESTREDQKTGFLAAGIDLDREGAHKLDGSFFWTDKRDETVELRENGFYPGLDYAPLLQKARDQGVTSISAGTELDGVTTFGSPLADFRTEGNAEDGQVFYAPIQEWRSFERERDLLLFQLNGAHELGLLPGLELDWAANYAETTQSETAFGARVFFEPDDPQAQIPDRVPVSAASLAPGLFAANNEITFNANDIDESQLFGRLDLAYERPLLDWVVAVLRAGAWYEDAERDVTARNLLLPFKQGDPGTDFSILGDSPGAVGGRIAGDIGLFDPASATVVQQSTNESTREIVAWHVSGKASFWERLDLLGGVRLEDIFIESRNDPFTGDFNDLDGSPITFPTRYLMWDRYDNPANPFESAANPGPDTVFNDQLLGIGVPIDPLTGIVDLPTTEALLPLVNGEIDEQKVLPSLGLAVRPPLWAAIPGELTLRGAWSRTVARPSFREMGFYVTTEPGSDELVVGNPQLDLSEVESWDARAEFVFGELGDLFAASFFVKTIEDPIEAIIIQDPSNFDSSSSVREFRTFFNNRTEADLLGFEVEGRLHLDLLGLAGPASPWLEHFSIGGNYTWIDAEVDRSPAEVDRSAPFFGVPAGDPEPFTGLERSRRLFNQPEWIANADISFEQPDWGTRVTLAFFAISDVLDAVGSVGTGPGGEIQSFSLDRYVDEFHQLDLVASQSFALPRQLGTLTLKASIKNLTDSERAVIYDPEQTAGTVEERSYTVGRDYSFSLKYEIAF